MGSAAGARPWSHPPDLDVGRLLLAAAPAEEEDDDGEHDSDPAGDRQQRRLAVLDLLAHAVLDVAERELQVSPSDRPGGRRGRRVLGHHLGSLFKLSRLMRVIAIAAKPTVTNSAMR